MNLKVECPERYPYDMTGVACKNPEDVTTVPKIGKSTWPQLETRLKGLSVSVKCDMMFLKTIVCSSGPSSSSFECDMGDLCQWSVERQESSPGDESGEKIKAKGQDDACC